MQHINPRLCTFCRQQCTDKLLYMAEKNHPETCACICENCIREANGEIAQHYRSEGRGIQRGNQ